MPTLIDGVEERRRGDDEIDGFAGELRGVGYQAIAAGQAAGLETVLVLINDEKFTKTANCWGVDNNAKGTNTNRVVLFKKLN